MDIRQRIPEFVIRREVFMKSCANWDAIIISEDISSLPWKDIRLSVDPGLELDRCVSDIVRSHVPSRVITLRSQDKPWFDDSCRRAYQLKQEAHNRWRRSTLEHDFQMFVELRRQANETYEVAEQEHRARAHETLLQTITPISGGRL